ncbi:hypothetical protein ACFX1X_000357 [Malus domestica]
MLKRNQSPNNALSSSVLNKLLPDSVLSSAVFVVARTSKRFVPASESTNGTNVHDLSLKSKEDDDRDQDQRGREAEGRRESGGSVLHFRCSEMESKSEMQREIEGEARWI